MPSLPGGDSPSDAWVAEVVGRLRPGERTLVLCRTRTAASLVRRWASRRGGVLGLEAIVPAGLAVQLHHLEEPPDAATLPPDTVIGRRIGDRPGLAQQAYRWARELRVRRALGVASAAPAWLEELLPSSFGRAADDEQVLALVASARARGSHLTASMRWDRVATLGFAEEPAFLAPGEQAVAEAMAGPLPSPWPERAGALPAVEVPDVIAEARLAVAIAARDPGGTVILVASDSTGRRVRDALERSGLGGAWRDPTPLGTHPLASAVRRAVTWFGGGDPSILAVDLFFVLSRAALGRRLHPAAAAWLTRDVSDGEVERFDERALALVLERTRLRDATLGRWLHRVQELSEGRFKAKDDEDRLRVVGAARHLEVRLRLLDAAVRGVSVPDALGGVPAFDADDFEDALLELLGEVPGPTLPAPRTLGALARLLVELRVRLHDDPVARAILAALRARGDHPASPARIHEVLSGPGLDPGVLADGVDVLPLEEWDGRPCRTLVVLDVHDHGLARPVPPDPLLSEAECRALGVPTGGERLAHHLRTLRRAAGRADQVVLVVTRTDASGRDTVAPVDLALVPAEGLPAVGSYGTSLELPELARTRRLRVVSVPEPEPELPGDSGTRRFLARGANLEWTLEGRAPRPELPPVVTPASLSTVLQATAATLPDGLRPWLGFVEGIGEGQLPVAGHAPDRPPPSVSRLLQPLARCAWQAFAGVVLGVRPRPELTDALDPRELGTAAHAALQHAAAALDFRRHDPAARWDDDAEAAVAALQGATEVEFDRLLHDFGTLSAARTASAKGLQDRWKRHFRAWVTARRGWAPLRSWEVRNHPTVVAAEGRFRELVPAGRDLPAWQVRSWIVQHRSDRGDLEERELRRIDDRNELPPSTAPDLPTFLGEPVMELVRSALAEASAHRALVSGDAGRIVHSYVAAEIPFGSPAKAAAPVHGLPGVTVSLPAARLRFGTADLQLQGQIDRVDFLVTDRGARGFVVTDYKTGKAETSGDDFRRAQWALEDPQLLVYAMVLARAVREGQLPPELAGAAAAIAHDRVRHTFREKDAAQRVPETPDTWMPVDGRLLRAAAQDLGFLVDGARAGRWPLRPHRHRCPKLSRSAFCDVAAGCRLRGLPDGTP